MSTELQGIDNQDPKPIKAYPINKPTFKVQEVFEDGGVKTTVRVEFKRLDSSNFRLLLNKEKETERLTETLTKNRTRERLNVDPAHENFFNAIAIRGWLKDDDEESETEISYQELCELEIEQKTTLNVRYLDCKTIVKKTEGAGKHDFLFKKDGTMLVEFLIGDPENPIWTILLRFKRPKQGKRSKFREDFAYGVTSRGGDLPITKTIIDLSSGVRFFDEHFETAVIDPNYSEVHFLKDDGTLDHVYVEGNDDDRKLFLQFFNPHFKNDSGGIIVSKFSKSGRES